MNNQYLKLIKNHYKKNIIQMKNTKILKQTIINPILTNQYQKISQIHLQKMKQNFSHHGIHASNFQYFKNSNLTSVIISQLFQNPIPKLKKDRPIKHYVFMVYGFRANKYDFTLIKKCLKAQFHQLEIYVSDINYGKTDKNIQYLAQFLSYQIINILKNQEDNNYRLSFIGHSMGGIIIRAALPLLIQYQNKFYTFLTFGSPHLGYLSHSSWVIKTGLWYLYTWNNCQSIGELNFKDKQSQKDCFLYKLSKNGGLNKFQNICLVSCTQDEYVPYQSSRIQKSYVKDKNQIESLMIQNIMKNVEWSKLYRINVYFDITQKQDIQQQSDIEYYIGRTGHIRYLVDDQFIKQFFWTYGQLFI